MKALTIRQPWASLIIFGYKTYEFRSWKTNYRGKILIHAGLGIDKNVLIRFNKYNLEYTKGAIIGEADLEDIMVVDEQLKKELIKLNSLVYENSNYIEKYAWKLTNIKMYKKPIYIKGQLGLWNYDKNVLG